MFKEVSAAPVLPAVAGRIGDHLWALADTAPGRPLLVDDAGTTTAAAAAAQVRALAGSLLAAGVRRGDRVAVAGPPTPAAYTAFLAVTSVGAAFVGVGTRSTAEEVAHVLGDAAPVLALDLLEAGPRAAREALHAAAAGRCPVRRPAELPAPADDDVIDAALAAVDPGDPAAVVYTSGSTGRPKGAVLPHRGFCTGGAIQRDHVLRPGDPQPGSVLCAFPITHVAFLGDVCTAALVAGMAIVFQPRFDGAGALELLRRHRVTVWAAVPAMLQLALGSAEGLPDLPHLARVMTGGNPLPPAVLAVLRRMGVGITVVYGSTETVCNVAFADERADDDVLTDTIGWPDPRLEVALLDDRGRPVPPGELGEVCVRGDHVMLGYLGDPVRTAAVLGADGWLRTGDLGVRRPDGTIALRGRTSEVFKSGGYNVSPREVEQVLEAHPAVTAAAVVDVPHPLWTAVGHAVVASPGGAAGDELLAWCRQRIAAYKVPKAIEVRDALPLLPVGKVDRAALRRSARAAAEVAS